MHSKKFTKAALLALCLFLVACGQVDLYSDLSEQDANEMLVLLSEHGMHPVKKKEMRQNVAMYSIAVPKEQLSAARALLVKHRLPHRKSMGLKDVYQEKGLIPTPDEQKARYLLALKGEIINSLERVPDVVSADVVLNIPTSNEFASPEEKERRRPTASVVILANSRLQGVGGITEAKIQQFVANAVEGLNPRDVAVIITYTDMGPATASSPAPSGTSPPMLPPSNVPTARAALEEEPQQLMGLNIDEESKGKLKAYLIIFFLLLIFLSAGLVASIVQGMRLRKRLASQAGPAGRFPALEGHLEQHQLDERQE